MALESCGWVAAALPRMANPVQALLHRQICRISGALRLAICFSRWVLISQPSRRLGDHGQPLRVSGSAGRGPGIIRHVWTAPPVQGFLWFGRMVGCGHVSGLFARC